MERRVQPKTASEMQQMRKATQFCIIGGNLWSGFVVLYPHIGKDRNRHMSGSVQTIQHGINRRVLIILAGL